MTKGHRRVHAMLWMLLAPAVLAVVALLALNRPGFPVQPAVPEGGAAASSSTSVGTSTGTSTGATP